MCLYPRFIRNKRYQKNKQNEGHIPQPIDQRCEWVPIGCGNCIECRKQKANEWRIRLHEELPLWAHAYFITLTFSDESLKKLSEAKGAHELNKIATIAVRRFLERYRKKYGHTLRHWLITELGHKNTERIHLHGIIFTNEEMLNEELSQLWQYGHTDTGQYCNTRTINYIVKYVTKIDTDHKGYKATILCSAGIGNAYKNENNRLKHTYKPKNTIETYTLKNGLKVNLPIYYRNYFFSQEQRERLWIEKMDKHRIYIRGIECPHIDTEKGYNNYIDTLKQGQRDNIALGYGDNSKEWSNKIYEITTKMLNKSN